MEEAKRGVVIAFFDRDARITDAFLARVAEDARVSVGVRTLEFSNERWRERDRTLSPCLSIDQRKVAFSKRNKIAPIVEMKDERFETREAEQVHRAFEAALVVEIADQDGETAARLPSDEASHATFEVGRSSCAQIAQKVEDAKDSFRAANGLECVRLRVVERFNRDAIEPDQRDVGEGGGEAFGEEEFISSLIGMTPLDRH